jgi:hypothetical protein
MKRQIIAAGILSVIFISFSFCSAAGLQADIDKNSIVDFFDFAILANDWRHNGSNLKGDITGDGHVDFKDVLELANCWLWRDPNLVGWWKFDEGSGTIVYDSAHNNNGTVYGAAWTTGRIIGALNFDGSNDYVEIPDSDDSLDITSQMTITAWIKPMNNEWAYCIAAKQPSGSATDDSPGNYEFLVAGSYLDFWYQTDASGAFTLYESTSLVTLGEWQHVAITLKAGDKVRLYINGELAGIPAQMDTFGFVNDEPLRIGRIKTDDDAYWFLGGIDDVRIYNRALSDTEIGQLYQQGVNP